MDIKINGNEQNERIRRSASYTTGNVKITDIDMPFWSMVNFMIKWAIASIPAFILLGIIGMITTTLFGGILNAMFR